MSIRKGTFVRRRILAHNKGTRLESPRFSRRSMSVLYVRPSTEARTWKEPLNMVQIYRAETRLFLHFHGKMLVNA